MDFRPGDVIEAIIDELALGELGEQVDEFTLTRTGEGSLLLDYGPAGRFTLDVAKL